MLYFQYIIYYYIFILIYHIPSDVLFMIFYHKKNDIFDINPFFRQAAGNDQVG